MPSLPALVHRIDRRWWLVAVVVVLVGAGAWWRFAPGSASTTTSINATVTRGTYKTTVDATGTITPKRDASLSFTSSGTVTRVAVKAGDRVTKGDVLATIDATALRAQRDAAAAQLTAAQTQLSQDSGGTATQLSADEASVAAAQSQLTQADQALADATLKAPFSGTVSAVSYAVGDTTGSSGGNSPAASSSSSSSSSATGITVISPRQLLVSANVSATDVSTVKVGMQAEITPTGGADVVYGTVSSVGSIASASDSGAAQFPVTITVTGTPSGLYPGSSAAVAITVGQATNVLTVPTQALHTTSSGATYVYTMQGTKTTKTTITIGASYGPQTEVLSGLKAGDVVQILSFARPTGTGTNGNNGGLFQRGTGGGGGGTGNFPNFSGGTFPGGGQGPATGGGQ
ncbi:MAG: secretion protein HlyD [Marmoricola sp.]|nr:secretion protein HlyD [Marmoricola sp.]